MYDIINIRYFGGLARMGWQQKLILCTAALAPLEMGGTWGRSVMAHVWATVYNDPFRAGSTPAASTPTVTITANKYSSDLVARFSGDTESMGADNGITPALQAGFAGSIPAVSRLSTYGHYIGLGCTVCSYGTATEGTKRRDYRERPAQRTPLIGYENCATGD